jgi:hypothetical protein
MHPQVRDLMTRLASDPAFADRYFADPEAVLEELDIPEEDREVLPQLDRDAVLYMSHAVTLEPEMAAEHPTNHSGNRHMTIVIALWGCAAFVLTWIVMNSL